MNNNINIKINNNFFCLEKNLNIIQVCNLFNIDIPKFCYHEKLSIAGNCRMCLVEIKGISKPVVSCALPISNNMEIFTNTKLVKKAREGVLEFILLNHPLDCPICDQGGECDLQDQSLLFGSDKGRFYEYKRSVSDKNCGPFIKTIMTRCIHCTRCIRYIDEIAGLKYLGMVGRGNYSEVLNFLDKMIISEVSGNLIDLCPVGALTSKPYSFIARSWELISFNTIDLNDIMHVNIRVDIRDFKILRILPRFNFFLNENWITDLTRFCYDGYQNNRITEPFLNVNGSFLKKSWLNIFYNLKIIENKKLNFLLGDFLDIETLFLIKKISNKIGNFSVNITNINSDYLYNIDFRKNYIFNVDINNLNIFKNILLVGLNLRMENPLLNIRLKFFSDKNLLNIFSIGCFFNNNYFLYNLSNSLKELINFFEGKSPINSIFFNSVNNLIIFGQSFLNIYKNNFNCAFLLNFFKNKIQITNLFFNLTNIISFDFNLLNSINNINDKTFSLLSKKPSEVLYALNSDFFFFNYKNNLNFFIYQGHHNMKNNLSKNFNILLPTVTFLEKNNFYLNFFGLVQKTKIILFPPKKSRSDFKLLFIIFKYIVFKLNDLLSKDNFIFFFLKKFNFLSINNFSFNIKNIVLNNILFFFNKNINSFITNIYKSTSIFRSSLILLSCFKEIKKKYTNFI